MSEPDMIERVANEHQIVLARARNAPLNPLRTDHDGHRWIEPQSMAWAAHGRELIALWERRASLSPTPPETKEIPE